ncbi:FMN-dependent NADH-azoreductase [Methyloligella solikamskensis]|uniref:FMN dependent NADH:quinone oxidoreductase n=1 Tax=Methyloligella solikamskensis TaxID=1177756 RepID=A0ABW3J628_9HYPH
MSILHVSASPRGTRSHSRKIGSILVERLQAAAPGEVTRRDLAISPPPFPDSGFVEASLRPDGLRSPGSQQTLETSETLIRELETAAAVVLDMPIHNFTVPAVLKAWIDMVVCPGRTFRLTPDGKLGMLADRPVVLIVACGGCLTGPPPSNSDFATPYLRHIFATIGIHDVAILLMEGLSRWQTEAEAAERVAAEKLDAIVGHVAPILRQTRGLPSRQ